jgi:hypothetical protein
MTASSVRYTPWMIAGALAGVLIAWATWSGSSTAHPRDGVWRPGMSRTQFETCLRLSRIASAPPVFRDLVIYPPAADGTVYIAGSYLPDLAAPGRYRPFEMRVSRDEPWGDAADVRAYIAGGYPRVSFRYAWWASPLLTAGTLFVASLLIMGIGIPFALRRLLPSEAMEPRAAQPTPLGAPESELPVDEILPPTAESPNDASADTATASVPALHGETVPAPVPPSEQPPKDFRGEFYPVAR